MAALSGNASARVLGSPLSLIAVPAASAKTSPAATAQLQSSLQYLCDGLAHRDADFPELDESWIQQKGLVTSMKTSLKYAKVRNKKVFEEQDQLRITHADLIKERASAQREASGLLALVAELKSKAIAPTIFAAGLSEAVRERDWYRVLLQSVAAQVQSLQDELFDIINCAKFSELYLCDGLGPLLR